VIFIVKFNKFIIGLDISKFEVFLKSTDKVINTIACVVSTLTEQLSRCTGASLQLLGIAFSIAFECVEVFELVLFQCRKLVLELCTSTILDRGMVSLFMKTQEHSNFSTRVTTTASSF